MMKPELLKEKSQGVAFMTMTPFDKDGNADLEAYKENTKWFIDKLKALEFDACTITPCGSNGEFALLGEEEHKNIIRIGVEETNGYIPVIPGTGKAGTAETIKMSKYAQDVGADGVQVILPYYFVPTEEGMFNHYKTLSENIDIGFIVYNNPGFSGSWIKPKLMKKIIDNCGGKVVGIKETTPHLMMVKSQISALEGTGVPVLCGYGETWYAHLYNWGAKGFASPFGNWFPEYPVKFHRAAQANDLEEMKALLDMMAPYYAFVGRCSAARPDTGIAPKPGGSIYGEGNVRFGVTKAAMNIMGLRGGYMGSPLINITDKENDELKEILKDLKLI